MIGLSRRGVLGMNKRNIDFVHQYNRRADYPKADDKLQTKALAIEAGISVPQLLGTIEFTGQLRRLAELLDPYETFVLKPVHGAGGEGIVVINGREEGGFLRGRGDCVPLAELRHHAANILHGLYSLGGRPDQVLIEERVNFDPLFESIAVSGVPDVRLIVFQGIPVMAMLRLPTVQSKGRANLHQGAVGAAVHIHTGRTGNAVCGTSVITHHPDTGGEISGLELPQWDELLEIGMRCYDHSGLGYLGVDIVYDKDRGPLLLEINARPGLAVQIANQCGLLPRLRHVVEVYRPQMDHQERLEISRVVGALS